MRFFESLPTVRPHPIKSTSQPESSKPTPKRLFVSRLNKSFHRGTLSVSDESLPRRERIRSNTPSKYATPAPTAQVNNNDVRPRNTRLNTGRLALMNTVVQSRRTTKEVALCDASRSPSAPTRTTKSTYFIAATLPELPVRLDNRSLIITNPQTRHTRPSAFLSVVSPAHCSVPVQPL